MVGLLLVFYNSKNLNCIGALCFYDSKRSIGEVLFLFNFIGVIFEAGNETREKIWSDFLAEQNEERSEKSGFCSYRCVLESEKLRCEKNSKRAKFFVHVRHFIAGFFQFFWLRGFVMILF